MLGLHKLLDLIEELEVDEDEDLNNLFGRYKELSY